MSFIDELKRRNVIRVGGAYVLVGWAIAQVAEFAFENFGAPDWLLKSFVVILFLGLPVALIFAWAFEMTPEGLKRERDVERSESITAHTGRKLDRLIIIGLIVCIAVLLVDRFLPSGSELEPDATSVDAVDTGEAVVDEPVQPDRSIAVLPFVNMTDDKDYFADGLSEELLNLLAKIPDLKVAGRTSSFMFKGKNDDLRAIGESLGVAHVLEGSVRRSGEKLRITAQLIKVEDGFHLWSETYDREMADIFEIQDDVAAHITRQLKLQLVPDAVRGTSNMEAYTLYLEAIAIMNGLDSESGDNWYEATRTRLMRATELDEEFAEAWGALAMAHWFASGVLINSPEGGLLTYEAAKRALEIDPALPVAKSFAVTADEANWSWAKEIEALQEFVAVRPDDLLANDAIVFGLLIGGYADAAMPYIDKMIEIEPLMAQPYMRRGDALALQGNLEEALAAWRIAAARGNAGAYANAIQLLVFNGRDDDAIEFAQSYKIDFPAMPSDLSDFLPKARDPKTGASYLDSFVERLRVENGIIMTQVHAIMWYLAFDRPADYWNAMRDLDGGGVEWRRGWSDADNLAYGAAIIRSSGFYSSPEYLSYAVAQSLVDLWERRGPPDHCQKTDGKWSCE